MKKIAIPLFLLGFLYCSGQQKIKTTKHPVGWQLEVAPLNPLPENFVRYSIVVDTDLDPLNFWDEVNIAVKLDMDDKYESQRAVDKAHQDTIQAWTRKYLELKKYPLVRTETNPDFTITLTTDQFEVENAQVDVDYDDPESILGEINVSARITVRDSQDDVLFDDQIKFLIDDKDGPSNRLRLRHLFLNPSFKLKFKMTKKPERKKELLEKRVKKYQAEILESFMEEAGKRLVNQFLSQRLDMYAGTFGIKDKTNEKLTSLAASVGKSINALTAFSKKKQLSLEEIKPLLKEAILFWEDELSKTSNTESMDVFNYNIALSLLFLDQLESAKMHLRKINGFDELELKTVFSGSFNYYVKGLSDAIKTKENYGDRAKIYQPQ